MANVNFKDQDIKKHWELQKDVVDKSTANMVYRDKQIACILRGMDFEKMVNSGSNGLQLFLYKNWNEPLDSNRLIEFDRWRDRNLKEPVDKGMRFGIYPNENENNELELPEKTKKSLINSKSKEIKPKREKDESNGLIKGTKKSLTAKCFHEGKSMEETINIVTDAFPDAKTKSISIWYKRARKGEF